MQSHHLQSQPTIGSDRALIETLEPRKLLAVAPPLIAGSGIPSPVFTGSNGSATVYDVTKSVFGATKNNNGDDDADAINDAVARAVYDLYSPGSNEAFQRIIYFPAGQYWIDEPIVVPTYSEAASRLGLPQQSGKPARPEGSSIWFFGEGSGLNGGSVSKIVGRNKPVWQNANNPRGIIEFIDYNKDANSNPFTNTAFNNFVSGLEIVANGTGGQLGIVWAVNNTGAITDVKVNDNGQNSYAGITLSHRNSGPALIEDVEVIGFKTGIEVRNDPSQLSITDTTVRDQRNGGQGIFVDSKAVAIENLYSEQKRKIPAVKQQALVQNNGKPNPGQVTILNSEFRYDGSGDGEIALDNQGGHLYARNVDVIKYDTGKTIRDHGVMRTSGNTTGREIDNAGSNRRIDEYYSVHGKKPSEQGDVFISRGAPNQRSLNLQIKQTPEIPASAWTSFENGNYTVVDHNDLSNAAVPPVTTDWVVVDGSKQNNDGVLLNAAVKSGAKYVALIPNQRYRIDRPIEINHDSSKHIEVFYGQAAGLSPVSGYFDQRPNDIDPLFHIKGAANKPRLIIQGLDNTFGSGFGSNRDYVFFQNDSAGTVVFKDIFMNQLSRPYRSGADTNGDGRGDGKRGTVFFENVHAVFYENDQEGSYTPPPGSDVGFEFNHNEVYARHLNVEQSGGGTPYQFIPHFDNKGGKLWMHGTKVGEKNGVYWLTRNNGSTEVLGAFLNNLGDFADTDDNATNFIVESGRMSLVAIERLVTDTRSPHDDFGRVAGRSDLRYSEVPTRRIDPVGNATSGFESEPRPFQRITQRREPRVAGLFHGVTASGSSLTVQASKLAQPFERFRSDLFSRTPVFESRSATDDLD